MRIFPALDSTQKRLIYQAISANGGRGVTKGYRDTIKPIEEKLGVEIEKDDGAVFVKCPPDKKGAEYTETELGIISGCLKSPQYKFDSVADCDDAEALVVQLTGLEFHKEVPVKKKNREK